MKNDSGSDKGGSKRGIKSDKVLDIFWINLTDMREWDHPSMTPKFLVWTARKDGTVINSIEEGFGWKI